MGEQGEGREFQRRDCPVTREVGLLAAGCLMRWGTDPQLCLVVSSAALGGNQWPGSQEEGGNLEHGSAQLVLPVLSRPSDLSGPWEDIQGWRPAGAGKARLWASRVKGPLEETFN